MRRKAIFSRFLLLLFLLPAIAVSAQDFKIRAKIDLVVVPVTVKSSGDKLVTGLTKDDFVILEDGKRQTITNFTPDPVPISAVVLIDSGLGPATLLKIQKTLSSLSGAFGEFDEVAIFRYEKFVNKLTDFTGNPERLEIAMNSVRDMKSEQRALEEYRPRGPFTIPGPVINGQAVVPPGQLGVINTMPPKHSKVLHDAVFEAAADLGSRDRTRRKIILAVSDGEVYGDEHTYEEAEQSLLEKGIQFYAIALDQPFPYKQASVLSNYAKATGGDVYFVNGTHEIENTYSLITEEARNQYILGYISNNEVVGQGPVFRTIIVETVGRNLKTLHRKGYFQYP